MSARYISLWHDNWIKEGAICNMVQYINRVMSIFVDNTAADLSIWTSTTAAYFAKDGYKQLQQTIMNRL